MGSICPSSSVYELSLILLEVIKLRPKVEGPEKMHAFRIVSEISVPPNSVEHLAVTEIAMPQC